MSRRALLQLYRVKRRYRRIDRPGGWRIRGLARIGTSGSRREWLAGDRKTHVPYAPRYRISRPLWSHTSGTVALFSSALRTCRSARRFLWLDRGHIVVRDVWGPARPAFLD